MSFDAKPLYTLADGDRHFASPTQCVGHSHKSNHAETMSDWLKNVVEIQTEKTAFKVIKGDPKLVERCDIVSRVARLRIASDPI